MAITANQMCGRLGRRKVTQRYSSNDWGQAKGAEKVEQAQAIQTARV